VFLPVALISLFGNIDFGGDLAVGVLDSYAPLGVSLTVKVTLPKPDDESPVEIAATPASYHCGTLWFLISLLNSWRFRCECLDRSGQKKAQWPYLLGLMCLKRGNAYRTPVGRSKSLSAPVFISKADNWTYIQSTPRSRSSCVAAAAFSHV
jgi:hypothetical protein